MSDDTITLTASSTPINIKKATDLFELHFGRPAAYPVEVAKWLEDEDENVLQTEFSALSPDEKLSLILELMVSDPDHSGVKREGNDLIWVGSKVTPMWEQPSHD